jgi:hypothetical protein
MSLLSDQIREYIKLNTRIRRHGDPNTVQKRGRKPVSEEHKQETRQKWYEQRKLKIQLKKQELIDSGEVPKKRGRPPKSHSELIK